MIARAIVVGMALLAISTGRAVDARQPRAYFTDVSARSQFSYITRNDYRSRKYFIQPLAGGEAILDYDNDGKMDIFFTNGAELPSMKKPAAFADALLRNRGEGAFEDRTTAAGLAGGESGYHIGAAAGDYDNDGDTDLFLANASPNTLMRNNGDGTFTDATAGSGISKPANTLSVGAAWFDYDNDRLLDLVVSDYTIWTPENDDQCADAMKRAIYCSPTRYISVPNRLYRNLGNGRFEDVTQQSGLADAHGKGMGVSIADVNNDDLPDIFIVNDTERNFLFINQGGGKFRDQGAIYGVSFNDNGVAVNGMGSDAEDFNNDGFVDLFYNDLATQVFALFAGDRGKSFRYVSYPTGLGRLSFRFGGWGAGFIDYDNDGWKDLYSANGDVDYLGDNAKQSDIMLRNLDGKTFTDVSAAIERAALALPGLNELAALQMNTLLGMCYSRLLQEEESAQGARLAFQRANEINGRQVAYDPVAAFHYFQFLSRYRDDATAQMVVDDILQRLPRFAPARLEKAKYYDRGGDCASALTAAQLALASDGNDINSERAAHILMARCYSMLGNAEDAAKEQQWIEAHPNPETPRKPPPLP